MSSTPAPAAPDCDPPPRDPAPAARPLPAGTCDTHFHVFGAQSRYPMDARRSYTPHDATLDDYRRVMRAIGVERGVIVQPSVYGTDNRATLDALRAGGSAFRAIAVPDRGYAALFHRSVLQADEGCDFDFLVPGRTTS